MDDEKSRIDELLTMLDLPKVEQFYALHKRDLIDEEDYEAVISTVTEEQRDELIDRILTHLAFRLRNEVVGLKGIEKTDDDFVIVHKLLRKAQVRVFEYVNTKTIDYRNPPQEYFVWWLEQAQPIHWIIAALIAKELTKENG